MTKLTRRNLDSILSWARMAQKIGMKWTRNDAKLFLKINNLIADLNKEEYEKRKK